MKQGFRKKVSGYFVDLIRIFGTALFPPRCLSCRSYYNSNDLDNGNGEKTALEDLQGMDLEEAFGVLTTSCFCTGCGAGFSAVAPPLCSRCGRSFGNPFGSDHFCGHCLESGGSLRTIRAAGTHENTLKKAIHLLKYGGKLQLAEPLGRLLFLRFLAGFGPAGPEDRVSAGNYSKVRMILPVPLHRRKMRKRGFNQSWLLLREWQKHMKVMGFPVCPEVTPHILARNRWTESQTGFGKEERRKNVRDAFSVAAPSLVKDKRVLIVDDVYTTGATGEECARVLLGAGALSVDLLTLSRGH